MREEIEHIREGKHGARSTKQAVAVGLPKARYGQRSAEGRTHASKAPARLTELSAPCRLLEGESAGSEELSSMG